MSIRNLFFAGLFFSCFGAELLNDIKTSQAIYFYNFLRYIQWPAKIINVKFVIEVYGENLIFQPLIEYTKNRTIGKIPIEVVKIIKPEDFVECQLVIMPSD